MHRPSRFACVLALALAAAVAGAAPAAIAQSDTSWVRVEREARAALAARDTVGYRNELLRLNGLLNGNPRVLVRLAGAEAMLGHRETACRWLGRFAAMGLTLDVGGDSLLQATWADTACAETRERFRHNLAPVDQTMLAFTLPGRDLIAEDIAHDPRAKRFFVSSVRRRRILAFDERGRPLEFHAADADSQWSFMALRVDAPRRRLWATAVCMKEADRYAPADSGRAALLCYDLKSGRRLGRWEAQRDGARHVLGDMTVGPDGTAYVSESVLGAILVKRPEADSLEVLLPAGTFISPQEPALSPEATRLYVPDYRLGIAMVDLRTRTVTWLGHGPDVALTGIDGLSLSDRTMIAIQNGTSPERVIRLDLDMTLRRVLSCSVIAQNIPALGDPTHGVMVGRMLYFIANSGWDRVNERDPGFPMADGQPPRVMRASLPEAP